MEQRCHLSDSPRLSYIKEVLTHFKGRIVSWDVVNEAFADGLDTFNGALWRATAVVNADRGQAAVHDASQELVEATAGLELK